MDFVPALAAAIEASALGHLARSSVWLYPLANLLHVLGAALMVGAIVTFDLAVIRGAAAARAVVRAGMPVAAFGLALQVVTGIVLFAADASHLVRNPVFIAKLAVIGLGLLNITWFHLIFAGASGRGPSLAGARPYAVISLLAWTIALLLGRAIAYV